MERIKKESINGNTPLSIVVEYLVQNIDDKYPRKVIGEFEQGKTVGKLELLDMLVSLVGSND